MTTASTQEVTTPTVRRVLRRSLFWIGLTVIVLIVVIIVIVISRTTAATDRLSASNPAPLGAQAVLRVLADHGVHVTESSDLATTLESAAGATVLLYDPKGILDTDQVRRLSIAGNLVVVEPNFATLDAVAPGVLLGGSVDGEVDAGCSLPLKAQTISGDGTGYRVGTTTTAARCYDSGDDVYSLVQLGAPDHLVTILGASKLLQNDTIAGQDNAALALNLLGARANLVWYLPGAADLPADSATIASLTPGWVTPVILLLLLTAVAAIVWRGRRLGALVIENLPVTVRASETMEGRARLYATASARLHALDSLRIGTVERVAAMVGLPRVAGVDEVVAAASALLGIDPQSVRDLLIDATPRNDRELVQLSDELLIFERRIATRLRSDQRE